MDCIYNNPNALIEDRVKDRLSRMTLQEKMGQMTQIERTVATPAALKSFSIGSILSAGGSAPFEKAMSADWADNNVYGATIFPHNVGLGATRDADLAQRIGVATALEVRASGVHYAFAHCVAVCKDPRWGRCYESYSEDVDIVRKMTSIITCL
ncbi:lysosomal beta glucosidase-like [Hibiscus syriacus]|uniref:lysosomal beta glucosidase-like n=1 Tax=Hibiscus syriacus TaxID=106335 RepID=UPI001920B098|nr:lysosomal beta glucosidase-like [Hibiscus syriacus]